MNYTGTIESNYYANPNGLAFDFTDRSEVTLLQFQGLGTSSNLITDVMSFWKKVISRKLKRQVNVIIIKDMRSSGIHAGHYTANYEGIVGVCENIWELCKLLNDKLYLKNGTTKRSVVFADCGGSIPAILTSILVPYHSMNFTNPYLTVLNPENEFEIKSTGMWFAKDTCVYAHDKLTDYKSWFQTLQYFDEYTKNPNVQLNLHWATNLVGSDLLFRNEAEKLPKRSNIKITDHLVPNHVQSHLLEKFLFNNRKYMTLVTDEIKTQFASIEANNV